MDEHVKKIDVIEAVMSRAADFKNGRVFDVDSEFDLNEVEPVRFVGTPVFDAKTKAAAPPADHVVTFRSTTTGKDRHGTRILTDGIDVENYAKNPVFCWGHDAYGGYFSVPDMENVIGRSIAIRKKPDYMEQDVAFTPEDVNPKGDRAFRMVMARFLNTVSIGFIPRSVSIEMEDEVEIPVITKSELLETSLVTIPSNPDALAVIREMAMADIQRNPNVFGRNLTDAFERVLYRDAELRARWQDLLLPQTRREATKFANLPLSERGRSWDAAVARRELAKYASSDGSGDKDTMDWRRYAGGFFWYDDAAPENFESYKLPFAEVITGRLVAVWGGITAAAQRLTQTEGPTADEVKAIQGHIGSYYAKAAKQYDDDSIVAPWDRKAVEVATDESAQDPAPVEERTEEIPVPEVEQVTEVAAPEEEQVKETPPATAADIGVAPKTAEELRRAIEQWQCRLAVRAGLRVC
ncbi:MAG: HK97 family phage prohead protease [Acidobacteria bacterium]|nr:HK97 family phage prohead protease [Acidobacteriota bacterium]